MLIIIPQRIKSIIYDKIKVHEDGYIDATKWLEKQDTDPPDLPSREKLLTDIIDLLNSEHIINHNIIGG